jgi:hypothetical protein
LSVVPSYWSFIDTQDRDRDRNRDRDRDEALFFELRDLDTTDLKALEFIGEANGITAKFLGPKIHLSRYAALKRVQNLAKKNFALCESVSTTKTGIKPTLVFRLADHVSLDLVRKALLYKEQQQDENWSQVIESTFWESLDQVDDVISRLRNQNIGCLQILRVIIANGLEGATYTWIEDELLPTHAQGNTCAKEWLADLLEAANETNIMIVKLLPLEPIQEILYCPAPDITLELICSVLQESLEAEKASFRRRRKCRQTFPKKLLLWCSIKPLARKHHPISSEGETNLDPYKVLDTTLKCFQEVS